MALKSGLIFVVFTMGFVNSEVVQLLAIWRHGDRAPSSLPYPNDQNGLSAWPRGWDQLTNIGIQQTYELGSFLRQRYVEGSKLLGPFFDRNKVFIQASDSERALESAQGVTAGLFPPNGDRLWDSSLSWQPVPIHSNGVDREDTLLKPTSSDCSSYEKIKDDDQKMLASRFDSQYGDLFAFLSQTTGDSISGINADGLNDIQREIIHGLPQPNWVYGNFGNLSILPIIMEIKRQMRLEEFNSEEKGKFSGGYLLNNWLTYLEALRDGKKTYNAVLYSSHDGTLTALQSALGIQNGELVPYAAAILLEVSRSPPNNELSVQIFYRNTTQHPPYLMEFPKCSNPCPLKDFLEIYEPMRIRSLDQLSQLCDIGETKSAVSLNILFLFVSLLFFYLN